MGDERVVKFMSGVVGNRRLCEKLCLDALDDKLSHACIIEGPRGTGKHTIARNAAAALACHSKHSPSGVFPCLSCPDCKKVFEGDCPDVITVGTDGKATLGVDTVRFLREDVRIVPNDLDYKIYIIEDADKMTPQAQNAFLLTLEEPPSYVRFFLLCENAGALLGTIRSRAPVLRTQPIPNDELDRYLCETDMRAAQLKRSSPDEYAELIMAARNGIGRALELLEPRAFTPVKEIRRLITDFADAATDGARASVILPLLSKFAKKREQLLPQLVYLSEAVGDLILLKSTDSASLSFFADRERAAQMCDRVSMSFLYNLNTAVMTAIDSLKMNANVGLTTIKLASDAGLV